MTVQQTVTPFISILIPCYNEERFIQQCLESILSNDYPTDKIEILVMDGMSTDRTREILETMQHAYNCIRIFDNDGRNKSRALNIGIQNAQGDILMRMDAHAIYDKKYISECVTALVAKDVDNVGGIRKTLPGNNSILGKSIAYSLQNKFAVGNSSYRTGADRPILTNIIFLFCCRKELFERVGLFDERLARGQDREFNLRLYNNACKMLQLPTAISYYYARSELTKFIHWIFVGGMVPVMITRITGKNLLSFRNGIPTLFLLSLLSILSLSLFNSFFLLILDGFILLYFICSILFSISIVKKEKNPAYLISMGVVFFLTHIVYGAGFLFGFTRKITEDPCV
ncbi:MAG: glycosyltransferase family 2 protein [Candidatus Electrothrix sp. AW2]|nr:glycosyltransferase family 2 protein [Candidatus Electrothrix gigas]MCI5179901.1 glycosyltransferase family 2 protein [Candidatus Electrothrix gigas]